jgi:choline dehydrogenase
MRKHYVNLENNHLVPKGTPGHGFDGFLDITVNTDELLKNQSQAQTVLKAAAKQFGQDPEKLFDLIRRDLNSDDADRDKQQGLFGFPAHRDPMGRRVSARTVVVNTLNATDSKGAKKYPLTLSIHSFVTKVLFDTKSKNSTKPKATGVEYIEGQSIYAADPRYKSTNTGTTKQVFAKKEVIIAGGAFNTPQILMLSGIGPKAHLTDMKIPVVVDLPGVGQNLQDNTEYGVAAQSALNFTSTSAQCANTGLADDPCLAPWVEGKGPYAQGPLDALMYTSSASVNGERDIFFFGLSGQSYRGYWPSTTVNDVPMDGPSTFDFSMVKFNPQGKRGSLTLTSNNPRDVPDINFRFFEEGGDIDITALADAVEFGRKVFDSINGTMAPFTEVLPCTGGKRDCDVKKTIRAQTWSHHATSSAAIGADNDPLAVLDSKFRVRGVDGLRVMDAAAFPKTPGAFPVIPTFMLGMKGADVLLNG